MGIPNIAASACAIAVGLERSYYFYIHSRVNAKALLTQITQDCSKRRNRKGPPIVLKNEDAIGNNRRVGAVALSQQESDQEIQNAIDELALRELPKIQRRTHYLSLFANISTLMGLLGTIFGLKQEFGRACNGRSFTKSKSSGAGNGIRAQYDGTGDRRCRVLHDHVFVLGSKANNIIEEIDESSVRLLNFLFAQRRQ